MVASTTAPRPRSVNASDPRQQEIEAIRSILKAKTSQEEAIKVARPTPHPSP